MVRFVLGASHLASLKCFALGIGEFMNVLRSLVRLFNYEFELWGGFYTLIFYFDYERNWKGSC